MPMINQQEALQNWIRDNLEQPAPGNQPGHFVPREGKVVEWAPLKVLHQLQHIGGALDGMAAHQRMKG